ncbi:MAG: hypothetical protein AAF467_01555 [Actinomycetota bacterium]
MAGVDGGVGVAWTEGEGFFLADDDPRAVGRAMQWARSRSLPAVTVLAARGAADLARRAALVSGADTTVQVFAVDGAAAEVAEPGPRTDPPPIPDTHWQLAPIMSEAGARPLDDHGVLVAEVTGLEVARVVDGADGPVIDIGVGQADRELSQLVHGSQEPGAGLRRVIAAVIEHRTGGSHHPLVRVARERWLRSVVLDRPELVGAAELSPVVPLRPRDGLMLAQPSAAAGRRPDGRPIVVVAVVGVDLDVVPEGADYRDSVDPDAELVLVMPERDVPLNTSLVGLVPDARAEALAEPWRS